MNSPDHTTWFVGKDGIRSVWRATVVRTVLPGVLTIVLFVGAIFNMALPALKKSMMDSKRDMARELTTTAWAVLNTYAEQVPEHLTLEEAQQRAIDRLRGLRYGPEGKDYFWINDLQPRMIMHPYRTELEGTDIAHFKDVDGKELFSEMVRVVESGDEGFVDYKWWWKDTDRIESKISFVKGFEPWGWIVGTGIYIEDVQAEIGQLRRRLTLASFVILGVVVLLMFFMVWQARLVETRRVRIETSLMESERKFRGIFHGTFQFIGLLDPEGNLLEINDTALEFMGATAAEVCGRPFWTTPLWERDREGQERLRHCLADCANRKICRFEVRVLGSDDREILMDFSAKPILDGRERLANIVVEGWDITEKTALQDQLRQSQKMEAVGQLAGGVAHDFNNILMGIMGHAELLLDDSPPGSSQAEALRLIVNASTRAGDLTRQLLSFSRKGKLQNRPLDLHEIVREVAALLSRSIDRRIIINMDLDAPRYTINGDPTMLQNAIINLGVNARDAMARDKVPEDKICQLTFATRIVESNGGEGDSGSAAEPWLELAVGDTGCGVEPASQPMVFEPFFTTKPQGEGTGLGLAGVHGCIESHGGTISLESELEVGTTFRILLPLSNDELAAPVLKPLAVTHGTGHILLVDDEEILRNFAKVALGRWGYQVTTCADGQEAVDYFRGHYAKVDLVILDLIMTRMGGEEAFRQMKAVDPEVKVLISSGFSRDNIVSELIAGGAEGFLSKPYKLGELSREVSRVMPHSSDSDPS
jgi:PAS domain S-box-containing protein